MWTVTTILRKKDKKWSKQMKEKAKNAVNRKKQLYNEIPVSQEAKRQLRKARLVCKRRGVSI